jgi:hypothetical protein
MIHVPARFGEQKKLETSFRYGLKKNVSAENLVHCHGLSINQEPIVQPSQYKKQKTNATRPSMQPRKTVKLPEQVSGKQRKSITRASGQHL